MGKAEVLNVPVYLDYLSTTPVDPRVADAMIQCLSMDGVSARRRCNDPVSFDGRCVWKSGVTLAPVRLEG